MVQYLVDKFPNALEEPTIAGWLPLHIAARHAKLEVVQYLVDKFPNALEEPTIAGWLPLHAAAQYANLEVVQYLVDKFPKALRRGTSYGMRPAVLARKQGQLDTAEFLEAALATLDALESAVQHQESAETVSNAGPVQLKSSGDGDATLVQDPHAQHRAAVLAVVERKNLDPAEVSGEYVKSIISSTVLGTGFSELFLRVATPSSDAILQSSRSIPKSSLGVPRKVSKER